jgi:hypothetical protein
MSHLRSITPHATIKRIKPENIASKWKSSLMLITK